MKKLEYIYNVIYYFYFKASVSFAIYVGIKKNPFLLIWKYYYNRPSVKREWLKKGIEDPYQNHIGAKIKLLSNPDISPTVLIAHGISIFVTFILLWVIYNTIIAIFFPTLEFYLQESIENLFLYQSIIFGAIAYGFDFMLSSINDQSIKYLKEFEKIQGFWRIKWKFIAALAPFVVVFFAIVTMNNAFMLKNWFNFT